MPKPKPLSPLSYVPLAVMAVSLIASYVTTSNKVEAAEAKIEKIEASIAEQSKDTTEIRISVAKTEAQTSQILDYIKDMRKK